MSIDLESSAPHLQSPSTLDGPFTDFGPVPTMLEGQSWTSGVRLWNGPDGSRAGIWICTPGFWECHVTNDEFCHFLIGRATYTHESGEVIEITPGTVAVFPAGWTGTCRVHETVRKVYMVR